MTRDQRTTEWTELSDKDIALFQKQFKTPYRSTIAFCDWLEEMGCLDPSTPGRIADIGCGMGMPLAYMAGRFSAAQFTGIDLNASLVEEGNRIFQGMGRTNVRLTTGNLYDLGREHKNRYEGIVSIQTLSWLPEFKTPLEKMMALRPSWIALTSLFFDGDVSARIEIQDHSCPAGGLPYNQFFYNVYAIPHVRDLFRENGYDEFHFKPFKIDIDLENAFPRGMGTHTVRLDSGERLQISGPLLMSWYFILAKIKSHRGGRTSRRRPVL